MQSNITWLKLSVCKEFQKHDYHITLTFLPQHSLLTSKIVFIQEVIFSEPITFNISMKFALLNIKEHNMKK